MAVQPNEFRYAQNLAKAQAEVLQNEYVQQRQTQKYAQTVGEARNTYAKETGKALGKIANQRSSGVFSAIRLSAKHRQAIKEGDFSVFFMPFTFALSKDFLFDLLPVIGMLFGAFITVYLFIFLWRRGTLKWKIIRSLLLLLDLFVPIVNFIPFTTFCVWIAYRHAQKDYELARKRENKALNEAFSA